MYAPTWRQGAYARIYYTSTHMYTYNNILVKHLHGVPPLVLDEPGFAPYGGGTAMKTARGGWEEGGGISAGEKWGRMSA